MTALCLLDARAADAAFGAAGLLGTYALAMAIRWRVQAEASCGCSWSGSDVPISRALMLRNLVMALLAATMAWPVTARPLAPPDLLVAAMIAASGLVAYLTATQLIDNHGAGAWLRSR